MEERRHHNWAYFRIWSFWVCAACALSNPQSTEICFALDIDVLAATKKILKIHSIFVVMRYIYTHWGGDGEYGFG